MLVRGGMGCAALLLALALLAAGPGLPLAGAHGWPDPPAVFRAGPVLLGEVVASCGALSPLQNACVAGLAAEACATRACGPNVRPGAGFTGTLTAYVWGRDRFGDDRYVAWTCTYLAGAQSTAAGLATGGCWGHATAEYLCLPHCGYYLWPPFRLEGQARNHAWLTGPAGSWSVTVER